MYCKKYKEMEKRNKILFLATLCLCFSDLCVVITVKYMQNGKFKGNIVFYNTAQVCTRGTILTIVHSINLAMQLQNI